MKVVVDIMGGDYSPEEIVKGCVEALSERSDFSLVMTGNKNKIEELLLNYTVKPDRIEIVDAQEIITNDEVPTVAVKTKKNSSLVVACERVKEDDECIGMVSAGSTGAVLTAATLKIGRIKGITRPALAPVLPTLPGGNVVLCDCGANVDCKPNMLLQFAQMGSAYSQAVLGVSAPKVALLSNGTEDKKGNELTHETFVLLKNSDLNFVGNMEARDILSGDFDVVVADGFCGNIALKSAEGTAKMLLSLLKKEMMSSVKNKLGALMLKKSFMKIKDIMDYNKKGGAPFLGVIKPVVKSHGSSKAPSIRGSIEMVINMHETHFIDKIKGRLAPEGEIKK